MITYLFCRVVNAKFRRRVDLHNREKNNESTYGFQMAPGGSVERFATSTSVRPTDAAPQRVVFTSDRELRCQTV